MDAAALPDALPDDMAALQVALAALREAGAPRLDPVRMYYIESLWQRTQVAPPGVQRLLAARLQQAVADCRASLPRAQGVAPKPGVPATRRAPAPAPAAPSPAPSPLAALSQHIRSRAQGSTVGTASAPMAGTAPDMKSVQRFRDVWSHIAAEQQVSRAIVQGPENAGPLNSHRLVLRSLALMRSLSPDYLRRFLEHADALLWLDQAQQKLASPEGKPAARRARARR